MSALQRYIAEVEREYPRTTVPAKGRKNMTASFDDLIEQRLEFGVNELSWRDFGRLAARMNAVDPEWRPRAKHRRLIAIELLRDGVPEKRIAMQLRISATTLWRLRADAPKSGPESRIASRSNVSN
jgi:hypothetical protein